MLSAESLINIFGAKNVVTDPGRLEEYAGDVSFAPRVRPALAVKASGAEQVSELVKLAAETQTPLIPVSSGGPHLNGDTIPESGDSLIVDLSEMNRIVHINRKNRVASFQCGAGFDHVSDALHEQGLRMNMPLLPRATKSVAGSFLSRDPVIMPKYQWDIADPMGCAEIVLGSGDIMRTGSAAGPGTLPQQWEAGNVQKEAAGPSAFSLHRIVQAAQGTMGIVTWVSVRCELLPELERPFLVGGDKLQPLLDLCYWLNRQRMVNECFLLDKRNLAEIMPDSPDAGGAGIPEYILFFNIAGYEYLPEERVAAYIGDAIKLASDRGLIMTEELGGYSAPALLSATKRACQGTYWKLRQKGGVQDIPFLVQYGKIREMDLLVRGAAKSANIPERQLGLYIQPLVQGVNYHMEFNISYDPADAGERERVRSFSLSIARKVMDFGGFFSRPYGEIGRMALNRDAAHVQNLKKMKSIMDPHGIFNPGKLGI